MVRQGSAVEAFLKEVGQFSPLVAFVLTIGQRTVAGPELMHLQVHIHTRWEGRGKEERERKAILWQAPLTQAAPRLVFLRDRLSLRRPQKQHLQVFFCLQAHGSHTSMHISASISRDTLTVMLDCNNVGH